MAADGVGRLVKELRLLQCGLEIIPGGEPIGSEAIDHPVNVAGDGDGRLGKERRLVKRSLEIIPGIEPLGSEATDHRPDFGLEVEKPGILAKISIVNPSATGVKKTGASQDFWGDLDLLLVGQRQLVQTLANSRQKTGGSVAIVGHSGH